MSETKVANADRMMVAVVLGDEGIAVTFADGCSGTVPFKDIPEAGEYSKIRSAELPNPYEVVLTTSRNEQVELPWDFVRHYCDPTYQPKMEIIASEAKKALGTRVQLLREAAGLTQEALAKAAGIERVTLVNLEYGRNAPKLTTLDAIAQALGRPIEDLLTAQEDSMTNILPSQRQKNNSAT